MERIELLREYLNANVVPILVEKLDISDMPNSIILNSNINDSELVGHYEDFVFYPPKWMEKMYQSKDMIVLIINNIDLISKKDQDRFIEILKYRQVSTFDIPDNYRILLTAKNIKNVSKKIIDLVAII